MSTGPKNGNYRTLNRRLCLLFLCQILFWGTVIVGVSIAGVVGSLLSIDPAYATLPLTALALGNILTTVPLSLLMQRYGRRVGFSLGAASGVIGGLTACYGIYQQSFDIFCVGNILLGISQTSAMYYRLAAMDGVTPEKRGRAIAWVMSGAIVAALLAPSLAIWSQDLLLPHLFAGCFGSAFKRADIIDLSILTGDTFGNHKYRKRAIKPPQ